MLITFLQDVMCLISGIHVHTCRLARKITFTPSGTPNTFENRNVIHYNLRIFHLKIGRKIRIFSLGRKTLLLKKSVLYVFDGKLSKSYSE